MCGFAGEFVFGSAQADLDLARKMASRLVHRGPDEEGSFFSADGRCAIGFRRLAILDPPRSHQPMTHPGRPLTIAFNGEIYNYRQLRDSLVATGAHFDTSGDTETVLALFAAHGPAMLTQLEGMFAIALYDAAAHRLFLARDRLGQKPLWYAMLPDRVVFASEPKALLMHPGVGHDVDMSALSYYCTVGYVPAPRSIWRSVRKLQPGHYLTLGLAGESDNPIAYWEPSPLPEPLSDADLAAKVRAELTRSVQAHMVSDVSIGALLSGGVDSAIVVALMARIAGRAGGVRTFTAGFSDSAYDERADAMRVVSRYRTEHKELEIRPDPLASLDLLLSIYDEPLADSSALPTYLICQAAAGDVKVALAGDGGDEVFGGYDRYRALELAQSLRPAQYAAIRLGMHLTATWAPLNERSRLRRFVRFARSLDYPPPEQYLRLRSLFAPQELGRLFTDDFAAQYDLQEPENWFCGLYEGPEELVLADEATHAQRHDLLTYLPDDLLVKTDMASMASSLELRAPMLDHKVVELGLSLPLEMKLNRRRGKLALRAAFGDLVPSETFDKPKRGFGVPLGRWLRTDLRETLCESLFDRSFLDLGIFRPEAIHGLVNDHLSQRDDHSHRLWALLVLARWFARR